MILDKLDSFNVGRATDKGRYYILVPSPTRRYYTLWFYRPEAVFHPVIYLMDLELSALGSVSRAIRELTHTLLPLFITNDIRRSPDNGDDLISFGKYRGYHLYDINRIDPRYVAWLADKYEPHVKSEARLKELAASYRFVYLDLHTRKHYKTAAIGFAGAPGDKLTNLNLTIVKVRVEDDPYKTRIEGGIPRFFVDQLLTAIDTEGHRFLLRMKNKAYSLASGVLPAGVHAYQVGEKLHIKSAKVLKQIETPNIRLTRIGYIKL